MPVARRSVAAARRSVPSTVTVMSETFTGSSFSAEWTNPRTTTGAVVSVVSNQASVTTGTLNNYTGKGGIQTVLSVTDFDLYVDVTMQGAQNPECFPMIGFRSSSTWSTIHGSATNSYWVELSPAYSQVLLFKRVGDTPTTLQTISYTFTPGDTIHLRINGTGAALSAWVWKNAETEPAAPQITVTDASNSSGRLYLANNGGADALSDEVRYDNVVVRAPTTNPVGTVAKNLANVVLTGSGSGGTTGSTRTFVGATWTAVRPTASMDATMASAKMQAQHIIEHGAGNAWPSSAAAPSEATWNGQLDPMMQDLRDAGALEKVIIFNKAPRWMVADPPGADDQRPTNANFSNFATISAQAAARYTDFQWGSVWNEYKGFWNNALNRPDHETYQTFYNQVYNAVKAVRPTMKVGGPYVTQISSSYQRGETVTTPSFPGGYFDGRWCAAMTYFIQNAQYDFLSFDMGIENSVGNFGGAYFGADPYLQVGKFASYVAWIRSHGGAAATCPIIGFETYVHIAGLSVGAGGYGYSQAQLEDLYIELCRQVQAASPGGPCYFLTWFHPNFWPELVTRSADTQSFTNTTSPFKAKVDAWHGSSPTFDYTVGVDGTLQQILSQSTATLTNKRVRVPSGVWTADNSGAHIYFVNKDFGNVTVVLEAGSTIRGPVSGIEMYGQILNLHFEGPGIIEGNGTQTFSEGVNIDSTRSDKGANGLAGGNISFDGVTVQPQAGTGPLQRNGIAIWGCDLVTVKNCTIHDCGSNAFGGFGSAGSGISIGHARRLSASGTTRVLIDNNVIYNVLEVQDGVSADRNGIILDLFHGNFTKYADYLLGNVVVSNNTIHDVSGRGIQVLCGGLSDSLVTVTGNTVYGQWARRLGGSAPETAIGGYGAGTCGNVVCSNNTVTFDSGNSGKPAYYFISFDGDGPGVLGSNNHVSGSGTAVVFESSRTNTPPTGFVT